MKEIVEWCNSSDGIKSVKYTCYEPDEGEDDKVASEDKVPESSGSTDFPGKEEVASPRVERNKLDNGFKDSDEIASNKDSNNLTTTAEDLLKKKQDEVLEKEVVSKEVEIVKTPQISSVEFLSFLEKEPLKESVYFVCNEFQENDSSETIDDLTLECSELYDESPDLEDIGNEKSPLHSQLKSAIRKKAKRLNQYIPSEIRKRRLQNPQFEENEELIYECPEPCVKALLKKYDEPVTEDYLKLTTLIMSDDEEFSEIDKFLNNESLPTTKDIEEIKFNKDIITEKLGILRQYYTKNWLDLEEEDDRIMKYLFEKDIAAHRKRKQHDDSPSCQVFEKTIEDERLDERSQENGE
uniref:Uncharacterized protein n=1 Tax=Strongyloides papillosus TaxID=174720 RepID=A0A0N5BRC0_STREA